MSKQFGPLREDGRVGQLGTVRKACHGMTWAGEATVRLVDNFRAQRIGGLQRGGAERPLFFWL